MKMPTHDETIVLPGVRVLARAIANAEGFGRPDAIPTRANNPGDLVIPGWTGKTLGAEGISVFDSETEGWMRLYHQLGLISVGRSRVYSLGMTVAEMADKWTATQKDVWAKNVASWLARAGVADATPSTLLGSILAS